MGYAKYLIELLKKLNLNPHLLRRPNYNTIDVSVSSFSYLSFIKKYLEWDEDKTFSIRLRKPIKDYSENFLKGFARGLMDTDGFLNSSNVACACISKRLMNNLSSIFIRFGFIITQKTVVRGGNRRPIHYVRVRRESLENYGEMIGFSNIYKNKALKRILEANRKGLKTI